MTAINISLSIVTDLCHIFSQLKVCWLHRWPSFAEQWLQFQHQLQLYILLLSDWILLSKQFRKQKYSFVLAGLFLRVFVRLWSCIIAELHLFLSLNCTISWSRLLNWKLKMLMHGWVSKWLRLPWASHEIPHICPQIHSLAFKPEEITDSAQTY